MRDINPESPEARRRRMASVLATLGPEEEKKVHPSQTPWEITKRIVTGVWSDGFIHAGNLAFLSILALFPFFIFTAAVASLLGKSHDAQLAVFNVLRQLPPNVASTLRDPIEQVLEARTGALLWFGAAIGLWTAASFVETIRDILRRAYGVKYSAPFWEYRLGSIFIILASVFLMMLAFAVTVVLTSVHHLVIEWFPAAKNLATTLGIYRAIPGATLFLTIYVLFVALTPSRYRRRGCHKWPGALFITGWWLLTVALLPGALQWFGGYDLTYGSLAGVMIALIFFFLVGLGVVIGAELNAALAEAGPTALKGEVYQGPYRHALEVEEPQPGEDIEVEVEMAEEAVR